MAPLFQFAFPRCGARAKTGQRNCAGGGPHDAGRWRGQYPFYTDPFYTDGGEVSIECLKMEIIAEDAKDNV
jgi:hypothetical protein